MVVNGINKYGVYFGRKLEFSYTKIDSNGIKVHKFTLYYCSVIPITSMDNNWKVLMFDDNGELVEITLPHSYKFGFKAIVTRVSIDQLDIAELYRTMHALDSKFRLLIDDSFYQGIRWLNENVFCYDDVNFLVRHVETEDFPYTNFTDDGNYSVCDGNISVILKFLRKSRTKRPYWNVTNMLSRMLIH